MVLKERLRSHTTLYLLSEPTVDNRFTSTKTHYKGLRAMRSGPVNWLFQIQPANCPLAVAAVFLERSPKG